MKKILTLFLAFCLGILFGGLIRGVPSVSAQKTEGDGKRSQHVKNLGSHEEEQGDFTTKERFKKPEKRLLSEDGRFEMPAYYLKDLEIPTIEGIVGGFAEGEPIISDEFVQVFDLSTSERSDLQSAVDQFFLEIEKKDGEFEVVEQTDDKVTLYIAPYPDTGEAIRKKFEESLSDLPETARSFFLSKTLGDLKMSSSHFGKASKKIDVTYHENQPLKYSVTITYEAPEGEEFEPTEGDSDWSASMSSTTEMSYDSWDELPSRFRHLFEKK